MYSKQGTKIWNETVSRSALLEEVVAFASYLPLSGSTFGVEGDGLIPVDTALMEGMAQGPCVCLLWSVYCYVYYWSFGSWRFYSWKLAATFGALLAVALCVHMTWATVLLFRRRVPCRKAMALTGCLWLASIVGMWAGDQSYGHYMIGYYTYQDLVSYTDVDPAHAKGQSYMDAGEVYFKEGTEVATNEMVSFTSRTNFCAAPIIGQPLRNQAGPDEVAAEGGVVIPEAGSIDFWAVGTNCCDKASRTFTCGQVRCSGGTDRPLQPMASGTHGHWAAIAPEDRRLLLGAGGVTASVLAARAARVRRLGPAASSLAAALGAAALAGGVASKHGALAEDPMPIEPCCAAMCSFLVSSWLLSNLTYVNFFMRPRGPDLTTRAELHNFTFVHNLLHMTGERVPQPFVSSEGDVVALYNGEIYNFRDLVPTARSDGEVLLPLYAEKGSAFVRSLDGEFALAVLDFRLGRAVLSTDIFSTKPLWYSTYKGLHFASYRKVVMVDPNSILVFDLKSSNKPLIQRQALHEFDLRQFKQDSRDFQIAFEKAVRKRVQYAIHPMFIGLSSGYDSGAIHVALVNDQTGHFAYTVYSTEDMDILKERIGWAGNWTETNVIVLSGNDLEAEANRLAWQCEPFHYRTMGEAGC
eukprot:s4318_g3.t2